MNILWKSWVFALFKLMHRSPNTSDWPHSSDLCEPPFPGPMICCNKFQPDSGHAQWCFYFFFSLKFPKRWLNVEHVFVFLFHRDRKYPVYSFTFHVYISVSVHVSSHSRPVYMRLWVIGVLTLLLVTGVLRPVQSLSGPRPVGAAGRQCLSAVLDAVIQWAESTARGSHRLICCCR